MIGVLGAGAFGTALSVALARGGKPVRLWGRDTSPISRENPRLPGVVLPYDLVVTDSIEVAAEADILLIAVPMQSVPDLLETHRRQFDGKTLVCCAKGKSLTTGLGGFDLIRELGGSVTPALLSGPGFANDIGRGCPTAMTLVGDEALQRALSTRALRLYRSEDAHGVEIGGAVKNVIAIACGAAIGMGLGESARAALMTRGFAEMQRLGDRAKADPRTLTGLSGLGDLALTCGSEASRNFRYGCALARGEVFDPSVTVEGAATAQSIVRTNRRIGDDLPICTEVARICSGQVSVQEAIQALLSRPLRAE